MKQTDKQDESLVEVNHEQDDKQDDPSKLPGFVPASGQPAGSSQQVAVYSAYNVRTELATRWTDGKPEVAAPQEPDDGTQFMIARFSNG